MGGRGSRSDPAAQAAEALYAQSLSTFTAERKRLADELRAQGEGEAADRVAKLGKPSVSAWAVNRLHRDARADMDALLAAGQRMRAGDAAATRDQRAALARLNQRAADILRGDGHAAGQSMLRRVMTTLQALSAIGSFDPDAPGQLVQDRDPPGFDLLAGVKISPAPAGKAARAPAAKPRAAAAPEPPRDPAERRREQRAAAQLKMLERSAAQAARRVDARAREVAELRADLERAEATAERLRTAFREAEQTLEEARAAADAAAAAAAELADE